MNWASGVVIVVVSSVLTAEAVGWVCRYSIAIEGWNVDDDNPDDRGEKLLQIRSG